MPRPWLYLLFSFLLLVAPASPSSAQEDRGEGTDALGPANRAAAMLVSERIRRDRPDDHRLLQRCVERDVVVVRGRYDRVEWVLSRIGVPYRAVAPEDLDDRTLRGAHLLVVNCPGQFAERALRCMQRFVQRGGHLLTTDWSLLHVLEPVFPGTVRYNRQPTRDDVVRIRVLPHEHPLLRDVCPPPRAPAWWLENLSHPIQVLDRRRVDVLIDSAEMEERYGEAAIVVAFRWGRGRVVHAVSHLYLQRSAATEPWELRAAADFAAELGFGPSSPVRRRLEREGLADSVKAGELSSTYSIQQFLANVVIESLRATPEPPPDDDPPLPPPRHDPPPRRGIALATRVATQLCAAPSGEPVVWVFAGLRLRVLDERDGWVHVSTPAGQEGWLRRADTQPAE